MAAKVKTPAATELILALNTPGMTAMHRAGLGGLACTLAALEKEIAGRAASPSAQPLDEKFVPGHPWPDGQPPWRVESQRVTLRLGDNPAEFLKRLFAYAFQTTVEGLIWMPGQYGGKRPPDEVLAALQEGLLFSFLQHPKARTLAKDPLALSYDVGAEVPLVVRFRPCASYQHQGAWTKLLQGNAGQLAETVEIAGPLHPGSVVRHVAYTSSTRIDEGLATAMPLIFAPVGCLTLVAGRRLGVLLIPELADLVTFARSRSSISPHTARECRIAGASDAVLQAECRLRATWQLAVGDLPACHAVTFDTLPWSSKQKSRSSARFVRITDAATLDRYQTALSCLPPRVAVSDRPLEKGKPPVRQAFWTDSIVRPMVADNLAAGRPWYQGFARLMTAVDTGRKPVKPLRDLLKYERNPLHSMIQNMPTDQAGEARIIEAVHSALRSRYGQIASENEGNPVAMKKRFEGEYERLRLAFAGAKTADVFRHALCDLFARARGSAVLRDSWPDLLPMLSGQSWQLARDLSLLALASYRGRGEDAIATTETDEPAET